MLAYVNIQDSFTNSNEKKLLCESVERYNKEILWLFCINSVCVLCCMQNFPFFMDSFQFFSLSTVFRNVSLIKGKSLFFPHVYSSIHKWKLLAGMYIEF